MRNIAAYLLLQSGGNQNPTASDIKKLLATVGIETDEGRLEKLITELKGKSTAELIAEGSNKLASVPSGGGGSGAAAAPTAAGEAAVVEEKKEEKKEEEKEEESDEDGMFGLFDD